MAECKNSLDHETVSLAGGIALMVFGAGLILSHPGIRRMLAGTLSQSLSGSNPLQATLSGTLPDIERYMKIRAM